MVILIAGAAHSLITRSAPTFCVETLGIASAVTLPPGCERLSTRPTQKGIDCDDKYDRN